MHYLTWEEYTLSAISMQRPPALQIGLLNLGLRFWLPHVASLLFAIKATTTMAKLRNFILFVFKCILAKQNRNYWQNSCTVAFFVSFCPEKYGHEMKPICSRFCQVLFLKLLKLSRNKKDLNDVTAAPFSVFQLRKRHWKWGSCDVIKVLLI